LGFALCNEYQNRYGKIHKSKSILDWCLVNRPNIPDIGLTPQPKAMPDEYKEDDVVQSYRNYYNGEKIKFAKWKNGYRPKWYKTEMEMV